MNGMIAWFKNGYREYGAMITKAMDCGLTVSLCQGL